MTAPPTSRTYPPGTYLCELNSENELERHAVALICTRAFVSHPTYLWFAGVRRPGFEPPARDTEHAEDIPLGHSRSIYYCFRSFIDACLRTGGRVVCVVVPSNPSTSSPSTATSTQPQTLDIQTVRTAKLDSEPLNPADIVAASLWLAPGAAEKMEKPSMILQAKFYQAFTGKTMWPPFKGWGMSGLRRILSTKAYYDKLHDNGCKARGIKEGLGACWTCELIGTDPAHEGKGFASALIREGLGHIDSLPEPAPCLLEANSVHLKAIYEHFGWEATAEVYVGTGKVDGDGFLVDAKDPNKQNATGVYTAPMVRLPPQPKI